MTHYEKPVGEGCEAMRVWLLGSFRVAIDDRSIEKGAWRFRKAAALVKLLALASHHRLHRERLMDLLWPRLGSAAAANNLRQTLHIARRILGPNAASCYLRVRDEMVALCPDSRMWVDVEAFETAAATARRLRETTARTGCVPGRAGPVRRRPPAGGSLRRLGGGPQGGAVERIRCSVR